MIDILRTCSKIFAENLRETAANPFDLSQARRIFPTLEASDEEPIRLLINGLLDLLPELEKLILDRNNLPVDKTLTTMIYTYLIMPFDLISDDENGLLGYLDDALIANLLAQQLEEPDTRLRETLNACADTVAAMMTKLPEWFHEGSEPLLRTGALAGSGHPRTLKTKTGGAMGFFEKVAFGVFAVVASPVALAVTAYEMMTEDGNKESTSAENREQAEALARSRAERLAKEKQAKDERTAIVDYARKALAGVVVAHSASDAPSLGAMNFQDLRNAVRREGTPLEVFGRWMPQSPNSDHATLARIEMERLDQELHELRTLREAIHDLEFEDL